MHSPEYEPEPNPERDQSGFSEQEMDLDIEVRAGEYQNLKNIKAYQRRSRQGKIIATHQAVSNRLGQLVALYYKFVNSNPQEASKMLAELKKLRVMQEILLNCLVWTKANTGQDDIALRSKVPAEVWKLIA